jgi:phosphoglycerol transferase MdoB-like AlkP superfamily enzyme
MTDRTVAVSTSTRASRPVRLYRQIRQRVALRPTTVGIATLALAAAMGRHFWFYEGSPSNILFATAVTLALIAALVLISRRIFFAFVVVTCMTTMIVIASSVKQSAMNMVVHAYDLFFFLGSWSTLSYLWGEQRGYMLAFAGALLASALFAWLSFQADTTRTPRRWAAAALVVFLVLGWCGAQLKGERRHLQFYFEDLYVSSFYASWRETIEALARGALMQAAPAPAVAAPAFTIPTSCKTTGKPPHIILIHEESMVQPSLFPTLHYDHGIDPFFRSDDGATHQLRVETYGGASWLTEFSLLAGVSTHAFGGMRQFVQTFMQGKLRDTLPQVLERCGYRNVVFYPMLKDFVSNDRFYSSIGLKEIFDMKAQGTESVRERDRFYFENAMAEMARHLKASRKPLFTYIQTMSAHWPYDFTYEPQLAVPGGGPGTGAEMSEYLRRVAIAKGDYDYLATELRRRFPHERFMIVHYGDHQPVATRTLLGFAADAEAEDVALDPDSIGYITYYAAHGINYRLPPLPTFEPLSVSYLGTVILELAGVPLSDSHRERQRLMVHCRGRYESCSTPDEILMFHRRLIDSGIVAAD